MQADIARGKTIKPRKGGRGGAIKGGAGVGGRSVATLRAVLGHAKRWRLVVDNPALGARQPRSEKRVRRLSEAEVQALGVAARSLRSQGENPAAVAALELMLLTGFRRAEALNLKFAWVDRDSIRFPDTKSRPQTRAIGKAAIA